MRCVICKTGETEPGKVTVSMQRDETVLIIKDVPASVCKECGEYYLDEVISARVMKIAENAVNNNAEVEILRFAA